MKTRKTVQRIAACLALLIVIIITPGYDLLSSLIIATGLSSSLRMLKSASRL